MTLRRKEAAMFKLAPLFERSRLPLSCIALAALAACTSPTPYQRPEIEMPRTWGNDSQGVGALTPLPWTSLYADTRLKALIRTALERNFDVRLALANIQESRAIWGIQRADQLPNVALGASKTNALTPPYALGNQFPITTHPDDLRLSLLSYEVDLWGRVASLTEAAKLNFQATEEDRRTLRISLISDVANAYFVWLESQERQRLAESTLKSRIEYLDLTVRKRDLGAANDYDVTQAKASAESARADASALKRQTEQAQNALIILLGGQWPSNLPNGLPLDLQDLDLQWGANLPSEVLLRRPDVMAAEKRLQAAHANIHAARVAFLPRLQLTSFVGTSSPALGDLFKSPAKEWNFVPSVQMPIFDAGRTAAGVDLAQARENQAVVGYEKTLQKAFREVSDLLVARDTLKQQLQSQQDILQAQRDRQRLTELRLRQGAANQLEWLDAQRDTWQAEQALAQTRRQWLGTTAQLYKALGGGELQDSR
jgi:multidrug efflux system outer membrane protein